jgi:flagellin
MPLVVNTNISSLIAQRNLTHNTINVGKSLERLSSGYRINRAADDAAGLTISETLRSDIRGMKMALQNVQDGVSILQITEGTLSVISENLQRIRELTVQAANDTNAVQQRDAIELEIKARLEDNDRIVQAAKFNGIELLTGNTTNARLHIGAHSNAVENTLDISGALANSFSDAIGVLGPTTNAGFLTINDVDLVDGDTSRLFLSDIDTAIAAISARRSGIGAIQNQLESAINNITLSIENFSASESRIRDLDIAAESSLQVRNQILQQTAVSILAQANQAPALVLRLLQN